MTEAIGLPPEPSSILEFKAENARLQAQVRLLRAGARDIADGNYANAPARQCATRMLNDTEDPR